MTEETIKTQLANAVDRTKASWFAVSAALMAARDRKIREQLDAIISHYTLDELATAQRLTEAELSKIVIGFPDKDTCTVTFHGPGQAPTITPAVAKSSPVRKPKAKSNA